MAKAAAAKAGGAKAPAAPKGKAGKAGKVAKPRTAVADFVTLLVCIGCTVWAFKAIIALSGQSF